jgi:hypothetical protein
MTERLSKRDRTLLAVGLLTLAGAGSIRGSIWLGDAVRERTETFAHEYALLTQEQALVSDAAAIAKAERIAKAKRAATESTRFRAEDALSAQHAAGSYIGQVAAASAVNLQEAPEVSTGDGTEGTLRAHAAFTSDFRGLLTFLHRLERGPLTFTIDDLVITQEPPAEHSREELHVRMTLTAFWLPAR